MKRSLFFVLACALAAAGCSGGSNSSNAADTSSSNAAAPAASAAAESAAPESSSEPVPIDLPVYPGAKKSTMMGDMNMTKCGHKESVTTYVSDDDTKTITDWYASRIPNGISIDSGRLFGHGKMTSVEIVYPDGSGAVGVTKLNLPAGTNVAGMKAASVFIGLGKYDPPFNGEELQTMKDLFGTDPAAQKAAAAKMRAKCGPNSVPAGL
jgi:hypothetical protein